MASKSQFADEVLGKSLTNTVSIQRFSEETRRKVVKLLDQTQKEILREIYNLDPGMKTPTPWRRKRLAKLNKSVNSILDTQYGKIKGVSSTDLTNLAGSAWAGEAKMLNDIVGTELFEVTFTEAGLRSIVNNTMIDGATIGQWWDTNKDNFSKRFQRQMADATRSVQAGLVKGESVGEMVKRVRGTATVPGIMDISKREATALVRTSTMQVANASRMAMYVDNADLVDGFQIIATLDNRTTPFCQSYDGLEFYIDHKTGNMKSASGQLWPGQPPYHWQCFIDGQIPIYTSKGWVPIRDIKKGTLVLTHKGRFRKVSKIIRTPKQTPIVVEIGVTNRPDAKLTITVNHPALINDDWLPAGDVEVGDEIALLSNFNCAIDGKYKFTNFNVISVKSYKVKKPKMLYNFSVEEDESYIAKGFVVHNCRTTLIPLLKSFASLAGSKSKVSKGDIKRMEKNMSSGMRASMHGPTSKTTYNQWLRAQPVAVQKDVLGPSRYALWDEYKLTTRDMVHQDGRPLTLKQLNKRLDVGASPVQVKDFRDEFDFMAVNDARIKRAIDKCYY